MSTLHIVRKPEEENKDTKKEEKKVVEPIKDPLDFEKLYGGDALPLSSVLRRPTENPHRVIGRMEIERDLNNPERDKMDPKRKRPFQPDAFDIEFAGTQAPQDIKNRLTKGSLSEAESRIAERPPRSVFDKLIDVRDWLLKLRSRLVQVESSQSNEIVPEQMLGSEAIKNTGQKQGIQANLASDIRREMDAVKNQI